jgi:voltage-gated potassium channel
MIFNRLTPVRAARVISIVTLLVTLASGVAIRLIDGKEFPTIGRGLWWAAETVTTVGYGDVVPRATAGRALACIVMVCAVAFLTVVTAAITAALIERERRRLPNGGSRTAEVQLEEISSRITELEERLRDRHLLQPVTWWLPASSSSREARHLCVHWCHRSRHIGDLHAERHHCRVVDP